MSVMEFSFLFRRTLLTIRRPRHKRNTATVTDEYSFGWSQYNTYLEKANVLEEWLMIQGVDDILDYYNVNGKLIRQVFNSPKFYRETLLDAILKKFPDVKSITEYGCGVGRNLLYLKNKLPELECYGYELCKEGVEIAQAAAKKFCLNVQYSQLDYVRGKETDFIFPRTDIAFTMFSLEQLPRGSKVALVNILDHVALGSIHIEPVPENYPFTYRGILGRIEHWKADYLKDFEKNLKSFDLINIEKETLCTAHNPLMFPTRYILKKKGIP